MSGTYVLDQTHRVIPVGHLRLFIEDNLRGLDSTFVDSIALQNIVTYLLGSVGTGTYENPCTYILHSLTIDYLRLTRMDLRDITDADDLYQHVYERIEKGFNSLTTGFISYLKMAMGHNEPRDFRVVQWITDETVLISKLREHDPFAF